MVGNIILKSYEAMQRWVGEKASPQKIARRSRATQHHEIQLLYNRISHLA